MGIYQQLTTEQLEVLILIEVISKFEEGNEKLTTDLVEIIDGNEMTKDSGEEICEVLEHYGYIETDTTEGIGYSLTLDGKQYIKLFDEYLKAKDKNIEIVHNHFSLINIEKIQFSLVDSFKLFGIDIEATEVMKFVKGILDSISSIVKKSKKA